MNIRETEEKLRTACEHAAPDDLEAIKKRLENAQAGDELVPVSFEAEKKKDIHTRQLRRICTGVAAAAVCLLALLPFIGKRAGEEADPSGKLAAGNEGTVQVQLESNPDIELTLNAEGRVVGIKTLTADAKAVMEQLDMDLEGADVKVAENAIIGAMLKKNNITISGNTVSENKDLSVSAARVSENETVEARNEAAGKPEEVKQDASSQSEGKKDKDKDKNKDKKKSKGKEASENMTSVSESKAAVSDNKETVSESKAVISEDKAAVSESKTAFSGTEEAAFMAALLDAGLTASDVTKYEVTAVTEASLSANTGAAPGSVSNDSVSADSVSGAGASKAEKADEIMGYLVKIVAGKYTYAYTIDIKGVVISSLKIISG